VPDIEGFPAFAPEIASNDEGFDPSRYAYLSSVQRRNFWFQSRSQLIAWALSRFFPQATSFLEVGCGSGAVLEHLRSACPWLGRLAGSEVHVAGLAFARRNVGDGVELYQMDARRSPFRREFDVVGCFDVLEHIRDHEEAVSSIRPALKADGGFLVTVPQHAWLWSRHDEIAHHERRYSRRDLFNLLTVCGFRVTYDTSFVTLLLPAMLLSRLRERRGEVRETEGLRVGGVANRLFAAILSLERAIIAGGVRLPVGGSLFAVAQPR
jgi:SAM-dependent methyltransferase